MFELRAIVDKTPDGKMFVRAELREDDKLISLVEQTFPFTNELETMKAFAKQVITTVQEDIARSYPYATGRL